MVACNLEWNIRVNLAIQISTFNRGTSRFTKCRFREKKGSIRDKKGPGNTFRLNQFDSMSTINGSFKWITDCWVSRQEGAVKMKWLAAGGTTWWGRGRPFFSHTLPTCRPTWNNSACGRRLVISDSTPRSSGTSSHGLASRSRSFPAAALPTHPGGGSFALSGRWPTESSAVK